MPTIEYLKHMATVITSTTHKNNLGYRKFNGKLYVAFGIYASLKKAKIDAKKLRSIQSNRIKQNFGTTWARFSARITPGSDKGTFIVWVRRK